MTDCFNGIARRGHLALTEDETALESDEDLVRVRIRTERGRVVDFVVQSEATLDARRYPVVRDDGSHGQAHRATLDEDGETIGKVRLPKHLRRGGALVVGRDEIEANWARYRADVIRSTA